LLFGCVESPKLPYLGNADIEYNEKDGVVYADTVYPRIPHFQFTNQDGKHVTNNTYRGRIWVVEFFFTSCPTICPIMNKQLNRLYKKLDKQERAALQFLSFSIDPTTDNPTVLKKYQLKHKINYKNWDFLTGNETETHRLGIQNFLTFAGKDSESAGGYAHSGSFTLVDAKGYVRGVYAVTNFDLSVNEQEFDRMVKEIKILYNEHTSSK
jgi:protein SCO1/2